MSLDKLAIIFLIIIVPISIVLSSYTRLQTETLNTQLAYDAKLNSATYDAVKSYQQRSFSEDASNLGNVRINNINAAVNTFYSSLSSSLNMAGYNREFLEGYVPALVFTMYDGYYIYSKYENYLDDADFFSPVEAEAYNNSRGMDVPEKYPSTYYGKYEKDGNEHTQLLYGLKPFIHYSCRYKKDNNYDIVITYSLDNYITIHGIINIGGTDKWIDDEGYLIDTSKISEIDTTNKKLKYDVFEIKEEPILTENLILKGETEAKTYKYHKVNGVKYYLDESKNSWFSVLNGEPLPTLYDFDENFDDDGFRYYYDAYNFTQRMTLDNTKTDLEGNTCYGLGSLKPTDAYQFILDKYGNKEEKNGSDFLKQANLSKSIFNVSNIEEPGSSFNEHRQAVIRYSIERNLSIAIKNYNQFKGISGTISTDFQMPEFSEQEWDKIQDNITIISYLQGLPIGTKLYSGVSVIQNNLNEEVVKEDSIYIASNKTGGYYGITKREWNANDFYLENDFLGVLNVDLEKREVLNGSKKYYYYPKVYYKDYSTDYVNLKADKTDTGTVKIKYALNGNLYKYLRDELVNTNPSVANNIASKYYTALGRERYGLYKQEKNYQELFTEKSPTP